VNSLVSSPIREIVVPQINERIDEGEQQNNIDELSHAVDVAADGLVEQSQLAVLRKSQRKRKHAISDDYVVYLQESDYNIGIKGDPLSFSQAIEGNDSEKWYDAMKEEIKSMDQNGVWELVELPDNCKRVDCKWVF
ncbi:unnamed protein product, partial [Musa textilis]